MFDPIKTLVVEDFGDDLFIHIIRNTCFDFIRLSENDDTCSDFVHHYPPMHISWKCGSYSLPQSDFYLPQVELPYWLTNGNYRVQGVLGSGGKEIGCLKVALSIHSD
uniref:MD-2-related lipid-recognition domain-containing protein n=1 Tax=Acanthochromis polyacanthus TaxID=80966 RepID=A0A3Q1F9L4_9TELE